MLDAIFHDLRYATRALRSSPGFAAVAILSLALGIGANTAIFSLIDTVMLKALPVRHPEELVQIANVHYGEFTNPIWERLRDRQDVFSGIFAFSGHRYNLAEGGEVRFIEGSRVSGQFFETLGVHPARGRLLTPADDKRGCPATVVLSYDFWQRSYGGNAGVLGRAISLDGHPFSIVGIMPPGFYGVEVGKQIDVMTPICTDAIIYPGTNSLDKPLDWWLEIIGRPKPGVSLAQIQARLNTLGPQILKDTTPPNVRPDVLRWYFASTFLVAPVANGISSLRGSYGKALIILMVVVGLVLLIACANVANLLLARGAARQREIAIRMALGSGRGRLIRQLLTESLLLSVSGAALGLLFAQWGTHVLVSLLSTSRNSVFLDLAVDGRMLAFTAGVAILTGLLFGIAPAWRGTHVQPQAAMKANARGVIEGHRFGLGKALVMAQVALSVVLVAGAGLMLSTFRNLASMDTGFDRKNVLLVRVDLRNAHVPRAQCQPLFERMLESVRAVPGVESASTSGVTPVSNSSWQADMIVNGVTTNVFINTASPGYFQTMGTALVAGRDFNRYDTLQSVPVAIVNETFAKRYFGGENPLGKTYRTMSGNALEPPVEIVGVVKDAKYRSLRRAVPPTAYTPEGQDSGRGFTTIEVRWAIDAASGVKAAIEKLNPDVMLQVTTLERQVDESLTLERVLATLSGFFGALALLLAIIGLYGVMSYNVARRRNEIGIRMALGAQRGRVLRMVLGEVALLISAGVVIGMAAALAATRSVASFLYGVKPNDPWTLALATGVLALAAVCAGFFPARRASRLDPMAALRDE